MLKHYYPAPPIYPFQDKEKDSPFQDKVPNISNVERLAILRRKREARADEREARAGERKSPTAPPPRMFNPTLVPPPVIRPAGPAPGALPLAPRHAPVAFNVSDTLEKALQKAQRDLQRAEWRASFWRCRCRDVSVWAASFAIMSFATEHPE